MYKCWWLKWILLVYVFWNRRQSYLIVNNNIILLVIFKYNFYLFIWILPYSLRITIGISLKTIVRSQSSYFKGVEQLFSVDNQLLNAINLTYILRFFN